MKQILLRKGKISVDDVPAPGHHPKNLLVEVTKSLISTGTEISSVQLSQSSLLEKARKKPEAVVKVLKSIRVRGLAKTWELVQQELDQSRPLGYSCAGRVLSVGEDVHQFRSGDRVACGGAAWANHAEVVSIPIHLAVRIPTGVSDQAASFVTVGAIALQGVRRADVRLGESVCVIGLGLIGQLTVQLLAAAGCRVYGLDPDEDRVKIAQKFGLYAGTSSLEELKRKIEITTDGFGVDATLLTASTESSDPTRAAFDLTRKKGRIVVVGAVGLELKRSPFYEKEQDFLISCSYGPGRYDPSYESEGQDYPYAYVRWTENRNMSGFLELVENKKINVDALVDCDMPFEKSAEAYDLLQDDKERKPLAVILSYEGSPHLNNGSAIQAMPVQPPGSRTIKMGLIGAGNFAKTTHIPNLKSLKESFSITAICTNHGPGAQSLGRQLKAPFVTTQAADLIKDPHVDAVLISTRHNTHASLAQQALASGKHVYLEKPLALQQIELDALDRLVRSLNTSPVLMVGFNRRYAPLALKLREILNSRKSPIQVFYRVSTNALPVDHWVYTTEGGGRLRGEACHMIDFFRFLVQAPLRSLQVDSVSPTAASLRPDDNFSAQFSYEDGSLCTLVYTALGHESLPKERVEVFWEGACAVLDDFQSLHVFGREGSVSKTRQDKGHLEALRIFAGSIRTGISFPIPWDQLVETTQAAIQLDADVWGRLP